MSNRKKWAKCIQFKYKRKKDKIFKSYWMRKFLNKMTLKGELNKCENFMHKIFFNWKKLQLKKKFQINVQNDKTFKNENNCIWNYGFKKLKFRKYTYNKVIIQKFNLTYKAIESKRKNYIMFFFWNNENIFFKTKQNDTIFNINKLLLKKKFKIKKSTESIQKSRIYKDIIYNYKEFISNNLEFSLKNIIYFRKNTMKIYSPILKRSFWKVLDDEANIINVVSPVVFFLGTSFYKMNFYYTIKTVGEIFS